MSIIIDSHTHIGSCMSAIYFSRHNYTAVELVKEMDNNGVNKSIVMHGGESHELEKLNEATKEAIQLFPDRLIGFVRINPRLVNSLKIMKKYIEKYHFKGVKLHPTQDSFQLLDNRVYQIVKESVRLNVPIIIHSGSIPYAMPGQVVDLASSFPKSKIIMAHAGKLELWQHTLPSAKRVKNVYLEFSFTHLTSVRSAIDEVGEERVLFGSNWPAGSMRPWVEGIKRTVLFEQKEKELFLGKNIMSLLGL
jgi:uncharacterized protein